MGPVRPVDVDKHWQENAAVLEARPVELSPPARVKVLSLVVPLSCDTAVPSSAGPVPWVTSPSGKGSGNGLPLADSPSVAPAPCEAPIASFQHTVHRGCPGEILSCLVL